ncbi:hypothetical protein [Micromonospora sp. NPDC023956]|uniref:hypothetical protein n=1 Tax=Micromonospora sp. NPDC023956 TaxID=3155722 RepID=UPI0033E522EF
MEQRTSDRPGTGPVSSLRAAERGPGRVAESDALTVPVAAGTGVIASGPRSGRHDGPAATTRSAPGCDR